MDSSSKDLDRMIDWLALVAEKEFEKDWLLLEVTWGEFNHRGYLIERLKLVVSLWSFSMREVITPENN
jgi:hypothetical protein